MKKRLLSLLLVYLMLLTACSATEPDDSPAVGDPTAAPVADATEAPAPEQTEDPNEVLVTINKVPVTRADFNTYLASIESYYGQAGLDMTSDEYAPYARQMALETAMQYVLMDQMIVNQGLGLTEEEQEAARTSAAADWDAVVQSGLDYYGITSESTDEERQAVIDQVESELLAQGYDKEHYVEEGVANAAYTKLFGVLSQDATVTDEEIVAYFNELVEADKAKYEGDVSQYESDQYMNQLYAMYGMSSYITPQYYVPSGYRGITHILLTVDDTLLSTYLDLQSTFEEQQNTLEEGGTIEGETVTLDEVNAAEAAVLSSVQSTVDEINAKLANGASFDDLIAQYGTDPGMQDAATLTDGYAVHMDSIMWDPAFTAAAFTVNNVGDVTAPIVGQNGVHILCYKRDIPAGAIELTEDMMAEFRETLLTDKQNELIDTALKAELAKSDVVYSDAALNMLPVQAE